MENYIVQNLHCSDSSPTEVVSKIRGAAQLSPVLPLTEEDKNAFQCWSMNFVYGELLPRSVVDLLSFAHAHCQTATPLNQRRFMDLGSGEGIPTIVAATHCGFYKSYGIELLPKLHRKAVKYLRILDNSSSYCDKNILSVHNHGNNEEEEKEDISLFSMADEITGELPVFLSKSADSAESVVIPQICFPLVEKGMEMRKSVPLKEAQLRDDATNSSDDDLERQESLTSLHFEQPRGIDAQGVNGNEGNNRNSEIAIPDGHAMIKFVNGDFLEKQCLWNKTGELESDVIFCNATCYDDDFMNELYSLAENTKPGTILIITSQKCNSKLFELLHEGKLDASWGDVTVRVYRRLPLPKWIGGIFKRL